MKARITNLTHEGHAQPVKRGLRGAKDDSLAVAMKAERSSFMAAFLSDTDPDCANGLFFAPAWRSGNSGDAKADTGAGSRSDALRHFHRCLFAYCAMLCQRRGLNPEKFHFGVVGISHSATVVVGRTPGNPSDALTNQTTGTGFSQGQCLVFIQ